MKRKLTSRSRRAMALITVLWITAILALIITVTARNTRQETLLSQNEQQTIQAKWALRAGIEYALCLLKEDTDGTDTLNDSWAEGEYDQNDSTGLLADNSSSNSSDHTLELSGCQVKVKFFDEAGKLNINTATREQLQNLPGMSQEAAAAIMDWRDEDNNITAGGAESKHYLALDYPYAIRNAPLKTVGEVLQIEGINRSQFFGEDTNRNGILDYNEQDGRITPPQDNEDDILDQGLIAWLTCYSYDTNTDGEGSERINVNQADENQLQQSLGLRKAYAKWIVDNRGNGFKTIADIVRDPSKTEDPDPDSESDRAETIDLQTFMDIADRITVSDSKTLPGLININTAPREVLTALFEGDQALVEKTINYRQGSYLGFSNIADLLSMGDFSFEDFKKMANAITVRTRVFTIECQAQSLKTGAIRRAWAVIDREKAKILTLYFD